MEAAFRTDEARIKYQTNGVSQQTLTNEKIQGFEFVLDGETYTFGEMLNGQVEDYRKELQRNNERRFMERQIGD